MMNKAGSIFFVDTNNFDKREKGRYRRYLFLIAFFLATRLLILSIYVFRGTTLLPNDAPHYLAMAQYIQQHWSPPLDIRYGARMFPGLPILIALLNTIVHNVILSGYLVSWIGSIASILLFFYLFGDFRMSLVYSVFLPHWVAHSTSVSSEGLSLFLCLCCLYAMKLEKNSFFRWAVLIISGYAMVVRNTAAFFIYPLIVVTSRRNKSVKNLLYDLGAVSILPLLYSGWSVVTTGRYLAHMEFQVAFFKFHARGYYPEGMLSWPGQTLLLGLLDKNVLWLKKAYIVLHLGVIVMAAKNLAGELRHEKASPYSAPFLIILLLYTVFLLSVGGQFGFTCFERFLSQINMVIVYGLFHTHRLRGAWIFVLTIIGIVDGGLSGLGAFLK